MRMEQNGMKGFKVKGVMAFLNTLLLALDPSA